MKDVEVKIKIEVKVKVEVAVAVAGKSPVSSLQYAEEIAKLLNC